MGASLRPGRSKTVPSVLITFRKARSESTSRNVYLLAFEV